MNELAYEHVIAEYLQNIDEGVDVEPNAVISAHPQYAEQLGRFFANMGVLDHVLQQVTPYREPSKQHSAQGETLGDFRVVREIGRGGMGVVYEAEQLSVSRRVALKVLQAGAALDGERRARFQKEVRAVARLSHDHIVPVYSVGETNGTHFYAMKLLPGTHLGNAIDSDSLWLQDHFGTRPNRANDTTTIENSTGSASTTDSSGRSRSRTRGRLREGYARICTLMIDVAAALEHAHQNGIVHRDVKPSNLLLDEAGKVWVTDFGLAQLEDDATLTSTGDVLGTIQYMSPEQATGSREVDGRSDVYSLGVVLYRMLTSELPFRGKHRVVLQQLMHEDPASLRSLNHSIPRDLETICLKCLKKKPQQRYQTAKDLAEDLRRFLDGKPIVARPTSCVERSAKWCARHPAVSAAIVIAILSVATIVSLSLRYAQSERKLNKDLSASLATSERLRSEATAARDETDVARKNAIAKSEELRLEVYAQDMKQAFEDYIGMRPKETRKLLSKQIPQAGELDHRDFVWNFLDQRTKRVPVAELPGHEGAVESIEVFPDGKRLASVGVDGTIRVWNLKTHEQEFVLRDERPTKKIVESVSDLWQWAVKNEYVNGSVGVSTVGSHYLTLAISPDGKTLATGNMVLSLWDIEKRSIIRDLTIFPTRICDVEFSPDGKWVAAQSHNEGLQVISLVDGTKKSFRTSPIASGIWFTDDGKLKAAYSDGSKHGIRTWKLGTWEQLNDAPSQRQLRYVDLATTRNVAFVGGNELVVPGGKSINKWPGLPYAVSAVDISPNQTSTITGYLDGSLMFQRFRSGRFQKTSYTRVVDAHDGAVNAVRHLGKDKLATCGDDGVIRIWDRVGPVASRTIRNPSLFGSFCCVPNHPDRIAVTTHPGFSYYDVQSGELLESRDLWEPQAVYRAAAIAVDHDGYFTAVGKANIGLFVWSHVSQTIVARFPAPTWTIWEISFSPDGKWMAFSGGDGLVRIIATETWQEVYRTEMRGHGQAVAFSPDSSRLLFSDSEGLLAMLSVPDWGQIACQELGEAKSVMKQRAKFTPDGTKIFTGHRDGTVHRWNADALEPLGEFTDKTRSGPISIHPDGKVLAIPSPVGSRVDFWSIPAARRIGRLGAGAGFAFSSDGRLSIARGAIAKGTIAISTYLNQVELPSAKASSPSPASNEAELPSRLLRFVD